MNRSRTRESRHISVITKRNVALRTCAEKLHFIAEFACMQ